MLQHNLYETASEAAAKGPAEVSGICQFVWPILAKYKWWTNDDDHNNCMLNILDIYIVILLSKNKDAALLATIKW